MDNSNLETEISWQIPEYEYRPKSVVWFWLNLIIAITLIILSIRQNNFLFAIFIAIAFLTMNILWRKFPAIWQFKIDKNGITVSLPNGENKKFYPLENIESFDIHEGGDEYKELILKFKSKFSQLLKINFFHSDEERIKNFLFRFIRQDEHEPSLIDSISKLIGF